jgi:hypothetical protein
MAQNASEYVRLSFGTCSRFSLWFGGEQRLTFSLHNLYSLGVMFGELARDFAALRDGRESFKARLHVGHDGTMIRLAAGLGLGERQSLRWPAMGSEIIMEVYRLTPIWRCLSL